MAATWAADGWHEKKVEPKWPSWICVFRITVKFQIDFAFLLGRCGSAILHRAKRHVFRHPAATFDRSDLRTLRASYLRALSALEVTRVMDAGAKDELAKLVFHLGGDRILEGTGLRYRGADIGIADEASAFLAEVHVVALCA